MLFHPKRYNLISENMLDLEKVWKRNLFVYL